MSVITGGGKKMRIEHRWICGYCNQELKETLGVETHMREAHPEASRYLPNERKVGIVHVQVD